MKLIATLCVAAAIVATPAEAITKEEILRKYESGLKKCESLSIGKDACISAAEKLRDTALSLLPTGDGTTIPDSGTSSGETTTTSGIDGMSSWFSGVTGTTDLSNYGSITDIFNSFRGETETSVESGGMTDIFSMFGKPDEEPGASDAEGDKTQTLEYMKKFWGAVLNGGEDMEQKIKTHLQNADFDEIKKLFPTREMADRIPAADLEKVKEMLAKFGVQKENFDVFSGLKDVFSSNDKLGDMASSFRDNYQTMFDAEKWGNFDRTTMSAEDIQKLKDKLAGIRTGVSSSVMDEIGSLTEGVANVQGTLDTLKEVATKCGGGADHAEKMKECMVVPSDEDGFKKYCSVTEGCVKTMIAKTNDQFECVRKEMGDKINTEAIMKMKESALADSKFAASKICQANFLVDAASDKLDTVKDQKFCGLRAKQLMEKAKGMQDKQGACNILQLAGCCAKTAVAIVPGIKELVSPECVLKLPKECPNPLQQVKVLTTKFNLQNAVRNKLTGDDMAVQLGGLIEKVRRLAGDSLKDLGIDVEQISADLKETADGLTLDLGIQDFPEDKVERIQQILKDGMEVAAADLPSSDMVETQAEPLKLVEAEPTAAKPVGATLDLSSNELGDEINGTTSAATSSAAVSAALLASMAMMHGIIQA